MASRLVYRGEGMRLEEAIQQERFRSARHKAFLNLIWVSNLLRGKLARVVKREGLTLKQYNVLRILRGSHPVPMSMHEVKRRLLDRQSDLTRLVDRLAGRGWVERVSCGLDRRKIHICITDSGLALLRRLDYLEREVEGLLAGLSDEEVAQLNTLLDKIGAAHDS